MAWEPRCTQCNRYVFDEIEVDMLFCNRCADREIERHQRNREWEYYHPGEPMPASERSNDGDQNEHR